MRGEHLEDGMTYKEAGGPSLRVRGAQSAPGWAPVPEGAMELTPRVAGPWQYDLSTQEGVIERPSPHVRGQTALWGSIEIGWVHPRVCGEQHRGRYWNNRAQGPSLRVRGAGFLNWAE